MTTMTSDGIFDLIEIIAATPSKTTKTDLLKKNGNEPMLQRVLKLAYDPTITFGIKNTLTVPLESDSAHQFDDTTFDILTRLSTRALSGDAAKRAVWDETNRLSVNSAILFTRIIKKDLRAGFSESTINKAIKGLIPDFPYMRCCLMKDTDIESFSWKEGVYSQEKADGTFTNLNLEGNGMVVTLSSRQGSIYDASKFPEIVAEAKNFLKLNTQTHGEIVVEKDGQLLPREISNGIMNKVLKGGDFPEGTRPVYFAWDQIPLSAVTPKGTFHEAYEHRVGNITVQLMHTVQTPSIKLIKTRIVYSLLEAMEHYRELLAKGKEGTVIKCRTAKWEDRTSKKQVKLKLDIDVDLVAVGFNQGEGKFANTLGAIVFQTSDGLLEVGCSGFSDAQRDDIWLNRDNLLHRIGAVKATGVMKPSKEGKKHSLFLPRIVEFPRNDKLVADSLQQVIDQFDAAIKGK